MRLCLVEDNAVAGLEPLTLTRPVSELLLGATSLGAKIARALGVGPGPRRRAAVVRPYLAPVCRAADPHAVVNDADWLARAPTYVANARWVPPARFTPPDDSAPWLGTCEGRPALALVGPEAGRRPAPRIGRRLVRRPGDAARAPSSWGATGSTAPGTWSPTTPPSSNATSRPPAAAASATATWPPPPSSARRGTSGSTRRRGSTPTRSSTPPAGRSPSRPAPGSSRSRGSRGPATWAATRTSSAPTCAAG